jgi:hypothetical protein
MKQWRMKQYGLVLVVLLLSAGVAPGERAAPRAAPKNGGPPRVSGKAGAPPATKGAAGALGGKAWGPGPGGGKGTSGVNGTTMGARH